MDNTKTCNTCNDVTPLTMFHDYGCGYYGHTCIDCHSANLQNASIMCNECGVIKPLTKFRNFGDTYGHLCHDC
jgi:DDE_Tnp_1-like zinc-ribbon